jgi:hypothetical protein
MELTPDEIESIYNEIEQERLSDQSELSKTVDTMLYAQLRVLKQPFYPENATKEDKIRVYREIRKINEKVFDEVKKEYQKFSQRFPNAKISFDRFATAYLWLRNKD